MNASLAAKLKLVPTGPGCYQYFDMSGKLLYVGKAKNLKKRVMQYFQKKDHDPKTQVLVSLIVDIKWIETPSEMEALILEAQLIKKHMPRYNIKIKDDKSFLYVKVNLHEEYPRPEVIRQVVAPKKDPKVRIFGPYTDSGLLGEGLNYLRKIFRWCELSPHQIELHRKKKRPCFDYYIGFCSGVCAGMVSESEYKRDLQQLVLFLDGKKERLMTGLKKEMVKMSKNKDFEKAARVRDKIFSLEHLGKIKNKESGIKNNKNIFTQSHGELGDKQLVVNNIIAKINAAFGYSISMLNAKRYPLNFRIELYDMSNISGREAVGSMVVWQDGKMDKSQYRKFTIKTVKGVNDFAMMREVLSRRLKYLEKLKNKNEKLKNYESAESGRLANDSKRFNAIYWRKPDLIILDGGKPQLSTIWQLFQKEGINIPLIGLAKREEEVWGIDIRKLQFVKADIEKNSPEGYFIQNIRDEAHRFAITFHKKLRRDRNITSQLDGIPGVGSITRKKLIRTFGSVKGVSLATVEDIAQVVGQVLAERIKERL